MQEDPAFNEVVAYDSSYPLISRLLVDTRANVGWILIPKPQGINHRVSPHHRVSPNHSCLSFEHHIKSLCSRLNGTISYLNSFKNTLDQKSRILLINALIFSHLNYCSSICGKCSEKLQYEVQKCINFAAKVASNGKYLKRDHVTPLLRNLKWINFNS